VQEKWLLAGIVEDACQYPRIRLGQVVGAVVARPGKGAEILDPKGSTLERPRETVAR
jgi:hypothetical protein